MSKPIESLLCGLADLESNIEDHIAREMMSLSVEERTHDASILLLRNSHPPVYQRESEGDGLPSPDSVDEAVLGCGAAAVVCFLASPDGEDTIFLSMSCVGGRCVMGVSSNAVKQPMPYENFRAIYISLVVDDGDHHDWVFPTVTVEGISLGSLGYERCVVDGALEEEQHSLSVYPVKEHARKYGCGNHEPLPSIARLDEMILGGAGAAFTFREAVTSRGIVVFQMACARGRCTLGKYLERKELSPPETIEYQRFREIYEDISSRKGK